MAASEQEGAIHHITMCSREGAISRFSGGMFLGEAEAGAPHPPAQVRHDTVRSGLT